MYDALFDHQAIIMKGHKMISETPHWGMFYYKDGKILFQRTGPLVN